MGFKDIEKKRAWANKYAREDRAFYKSIHRCITCHGQDAFTLGGRSRCAACAEKAREYYYKNGEKYKKAKAEKKKSLYEERKAAGKCVSCGRDMDGGGYVRCAACRAKDAARHRTGSMKGVNGYCSLCGKEKAENGKLCPACYVKISANTAKARAAQNRGDHPWRRDEQLRIMSITGRTA